MASLLPEIAGEAVSREVLASVAMAVSMISPPGAVQPTNKRNRNVAAQRNVDTFTEIRIDVTQKPANKNKAFKTDCR